VWRRERFAKAYLCPLEDPFDATDNAARAVGSESVSPGDQNVYIAAVMGANAAALRRLLLQDGTSPPGVRVLRGLAWTLGFRGIQLLQPPLPAPQLHALQGVMGDPKLGSPLQRLLEHLGADLVEEDILDHFQWKAYRARQRDAALARAAASGGGAAAVMAGGGSKGGRRQRDGGGARQDGGGGGGAPAARQQHPPPPPARARAAAAGQPANHQQPPPPPPRQQTAGGGADELTFRLGGLTVEEGPGPRGGRQPLSPPPVPQQDQYVGAQRQPAYSYN
jgi:hypothetical protein